MLFSLPSSNVVDVVEVDEPDIWRGISPGGIDYFAHYGIDIGRFRRKVSNGV